MFSSVERELPEQLPQVFTALRRNAERHRLAAPRRVRFSNEVVWNPGDLEAKMCLEKLALVTSGEGYSVGAGLCWARFAGSVDALRERNASRHVRADDDVVVERPP